MIILENRAFFKLWRLASLDAELGIFENYRGKFFHEKTKADEHSIGGGDEDGDDEKFTGVQEGEIEEVASERDEDGESDDGGGSDEEGCAEKIKWLGYAKNEEEVNSKSDDGRSSDELGASVAEVASEDSQGKHGDGDSDAGGDGKLEDVGQKLVFDASGVFF